MNQVYNREQLLTRTENDLNFIDIDGFYNFEAQANGETIAELSHDAFNSVNPWYVSVAGIEVYRSALYCEATDWVKSQYVAGTLTNHLHCQVQVLTTRSERAATVEVLEQHGDEFVVHNCENDHYYVVRPNHPELKRRCECADCHYRGVKCKHQIAVENFVKPSLVAQVTEKSCSVCWGSGELGDEDCLERCYYCDGKGIEEPKKVIAVSIDELLDKPFDELSSEDWERLKNYPAPTESMELVAA